MKNNQTMIQIQIQIEIVLLAV